MGLVQFLFLLLLFVQCKSQQTNTVKIISGIVLEETAPLPGSTIVVKRTRKQVQADTDGKFNLQVLKGDTLIVSYTGLEPNEIIITSKNHYTITLHSVVQPSRKSKRYYRRYAKDHNGMIPEF